MDCCEYVFFIASQIVHNDNRNAVKLLLLMPLQMQEQVAMCMRRIKQQQHNELLEKVSMLSKTSPTLPS